MILKREHGTKVTEQKLLVCVCTDNLQDLLVYLHLVGFAFLAHGVLLLLGVEDLALSVTGLLELLATEVIVVQSLGELDAGDVDLCLCSDDVDLVNTAEWAAI